MTDARDDDLSVNINKYEIHENGNLEADAIIKGNKSKSVDIKCSRMINELIFIQGTFRDTRL